MTRSPGPEDLCWLPLQVRQVLYVIYSLVLLPLALSLGLSPNELLLYAFLFYFMLCWKLKSTGL